MDSRQWREAHPEVFYLDPEDLGGIDDYLRIRELVSPGEKVVHASRAGDGNMNCVVRATIKRGAGAPDADRTVILKQSRPWVEKYPQFKAPWDRAVREMEFYRIVGQHEPVARRMPRLALGDEASRTLIFEDLAPGEDASSVYAGDQFTQEEIDQLADYLSELHDFTHGWRDRAGLANREMRDLNSQHIFFIPLQEANGLDLDAVCVGLSSAATSLKHDTLYVRAVHRLAQTYLADGDCLLHGDVFPGSLFRTRDGLCVIDAEFAFFGPPEFDIAVFLAHLRLAGQSALLAARFLERYRATAGFDPGTVSRFAGVELMRRLIGYAQLPLGVGLARRVELLELSRHAVLSPDIACFMVD